MLTVRHIYIGLTADLVDGHDSIVMLWFCKEMYTNPIVEL